MSCKTRLKKAYDHAKRLSLQERCRYVVISDCHRGTGTVYDNFLKNQHLYFAALEYYYMRRFCYIELGDGEELWENRDYKRIRECHRNVYWMCSILFSGGFHVSLSDISGNHWRSLASMIRQARQSTIKNRKNMSIVWKNLRMR